MLNIDENGKVYVIPEALEYKEIMDIPADHLGEVIKYVYHAYKSPHPFDIYGPTERKKKVCATYFIDKTPEQFDKPSYMKPLVKRFMDEAMTKAEVFLLSIRKDMDELMEHMREIPLFKEGKVDVVVPVKIEGDMRDVSVKAKVRIDNSEEKFKVLKRLDDLLTMMEKMETKVMQQRKEKRSERKRIFDA